MACGFPALALCASLGAAGVVPQPLEEHRFALTVPAVPLPADAAFSFDAPYPLWVEVDGARVERNPELPSLVPLTSANHGLVYQDPPGRKPRDAVRFGSARALLASDLTDDRVQFAVGVVLVIAGAALLLTALVRRGGLPLPSLGLFSLAVGMLSVGQSDTWVPLFLPNETFWWAARMVSIFLIPIGFGTFVAGVFGDTRQRWLRRLSLLLAGWLVLSIALHALGWVNLYVARRGAYVLLLATIAVIISRVWTIRKTDPLTRTFIGGFAVLVAFSLPDMLWGAGLKVIDAHGAPLGMLAFVISGGWMLAQRAAQQQRATQTALNEVQALNSELRTQIERRSRDLKELFVTTQAPPNGLVVDPAPGTVLDGRYRVRSKLGEGAMGAVFDVERLTDTRRFALKVLTGAVTGTDAARFAREAEIAAKLSHPNLVGIVDVGRGDNGLVYLVMELVEGRTLENARGQFGDVAFGRPLLAQLAAGLQALHDGGFVHRDLKPANVLLARDAAGAETVRIADFGVARSTAPEAPSAVNFKLTQSGAWIGTPLYMAPESAQGAVSTKADVYALGLIGFELLIGRYPFEEPPIVSMMKGEPLKPVPWPPGLDAKLQALLSRCLATDPGARPAAAELAAL
jgi:hypothetical protein